MIIVLQEVIMQDGGQTQVILKESLNSYLRFDDRDATPGLASGRPGVAVRR